MIRSMIFAIGFVLYLSWDLIVQVEKNFHFPKPKLQSTQRPIFEEEKVKVKYSHREVECLAQNVFFEAGTEDILGKIAVAQVTLNRVKTGYWGQHICEVVHSPDQFSWTNDEERVNSRPTGPNWTDSVLVAKTVLENGIRIKQLKYALFYHATYVTPNWHDNSSRIGQIGTHIYYERAKGSWVSL